MDLKIGASVFGGTCVLIGCISLQKQRKFFSPDLRLAFGSTIDVSDSFDGGRMMEIEFQTPEGRKVRFREYGRSPNDDLRPGIAQVFWRGIRGGKIGIIGTPQPVIYLKSHPEVAQVFRSDRWIAPLFFIFLGVAICVATYLA